MGLLYEVRAAFIGLGLGLGTPSGRGALKSPYWTCGEVLGAKLQQIRAARGAKVDVGLSRVCRM